jgi:hypothetical protein
VVLDAQNPLDLRPERLLSLATALERSDRTIRVELGYRPLTGLGVTWWEVLMHGFLGRTLSTPLQRRSFCRS